MKNAPDEGAEMDKANGNAKRTKQGGNEHPPVPVRGVVERAQEVAGRVVEEVGHQIEEAGLAIGEAGERLMEVGRKIKPEDQEPNPGST